MKYTEAHRQMLIDEMWLDLERVAQRLYQLGQVRRSWWMRGLADGVAGRGQREKSERHRSYLHGYAAGCEQAPVEVD